MGGHQHTNSKPPIYIKIDIFGVIFHARTSPNSKHGFTTKSFEKKDAFEKPGNCHLVVSFNLEDGSLFGVFFG